MIKTLICEIVTIYNSTYVYYVPFYNDITKKKFSFKCHALYLFCKLYIVFNFVLANILIPQELINIQNLFLQFIFYDLNSY